MPTFPVTTEGRRTGGFLVREANGYRSREVVILASNGTTAQTLLAGTVLAKVTATGKYVPYDNVGADGTEVAAGILFDNVIVPATGDIRATATVRDAEVNAAELVYDASLSGGTLTTAQAAAATDLDARGIAFRYAS